MAEEAVAEQESREEAKARKAEEKAKKKEEKAKKKAEKKAAKQENEMEEEAETGGGKLVVALATIVIIAIWLGILALLVRLDVGGFGSTVLYPILKDVKYVNRILPEVKPEEGEDANPDYPYKTMEEAVARIQQLEKSLAKAKKKNSNDSATIEDLQAQIRRLKKYQQNEAAFEEEKQAFYEEVVFADEAPDISEYQKYYEMIDPDNAEILYKEVIEQQQYDDNLDEYVATYSSMKPAAAAALFDTMTDNLKLVARILDNMGSEDRANILAAMNPETAAKLTEMLEPEQN